MITGAILCSICIGVLAILSGLHSYAYDASPTVEEQVTSANTGKSGNPLFLFFDADRSTIAFLIVMYICVAVYSCTWGTLGWIYPAELYSQGVRAKALGISTASNWLFTYAVLQLTPIMLKKIQWRTYLLFSIMCLIIAAVVHWYFPETNVSIRKRA
jgi:MFS family permease